MNRSKIINPIFKFCAALAFLPISAFSDSTIDEIIVTSDFRDSTLLQTPASVTVIDSAAIAQRQARHLEQVLNLAPNVNFSSGASRGRFIQIRGIGERSQFIEPLNPSVGTLVDGIDFTGIAGAATTMDIAQIEILRGPQGTLYGANALAGLINVRSNQPSEQLQGNMQVSVGDYGTGTVSAAVGGPISESLGYRVAVQQHSSDGYIENDFLKRDDTNNIDELSLRTILDWQASDDLDLKLTLFHVDADNGYDGFSLDNTRHTLSDTPGHDRHKATAAAVESRWQGAENFQLVSLLSFADNDLEYGYDEDWAFPDICTGQPCEGWEYNSADNYSRQRDNASVDIKLVSEPKARILNGSSGWVVGMYWRDQDEQLLREYTYAGGDFTSDFDTTNKALYAQLDTELSESLTLVSGLRVENRDAYYSDSDSVAHSVGESLWGGRLALQYQITADQMIYGLVSRGYKAGGVNSDPALVSEDREFDTELMWNFEAGLKGRWLEDRLQAQVAAFYQKRDDIQIKQSLVQSRVDSNAVDFTDYFGNAASGANYGIEVEFNWLASESLTWFGSLGLLSADYDIPKSEDLDSRPQAHAPDYQFALGGSHQISDTLSISVDVEGKDKFYLSSSHNEQTQAYELVNARINYFLNGWDLSLWGRNLTNKDVIVRGFGGFGNDPRKFYATEAYYQFGEPRMFGVSGQYDF
ncbi:TonB-dependent receptor [gamma proteobacterium HTCC2207]|uniref:TonB-dependent receptor n=1 Tax=gamma proteobacterium HTCC2207 TaxID=314287 RepID=Q1YRJ5_9GAMM|nr:TonB-dependent receptor [gamma proteobacterium HTCC2207]